MNPGIYIMLKNQLSIWIFVVAVIFSGSPVYGQYAPDTSLTYSTFLKECQDFARSGRQEVWVVNFWASYNGASLYSLPDLKRVYDEYRNKPVRFVSISVDKVRSNWEKRLPQYDMPWEHLFLPSESDYTFLKNAFAHNSLPGIFLVNPRAQVQRVHDTNELRTSLSMETQNLPNRPWQPNGISPEYDEPATPIREEKTASAANSKSDADISGGWMMHTVQPSETLFSLYRKYGVSVSEIKRINGLTTNTIKVGQKLRIKQI
ncbi:MAG: LysM peptidoglycan-binding domain-containing protein [Bacteroidia bacterium]|nr:LysM peptidoglycan-binding domain-containing protein [Bacteroidia bacterium]